MHWSLQLIKKQDEHIWNKEQNRSTYLILITFYCTFNEMPIWNWSSLLLQSDIFNQNEVGVQSYEGERSAVGANAY